MCVQSMLYHVDPTLRKLSRNEKEAWNDVRGRAVYSGMLITDQMKGAQDMMTESLYPGQKGQHPEFGEEILKLARELCGGGGDEEGKEGEAGDEGEEWEEVKEEEKDDENKKSKKKNKNKKRKKSKKN